MSDQARLDAFIQRFHAGLRTFPDGRREMDPTALVSLVREDPQSAIAAIHTFRAGAGPQHLEFAVSLAWAYAMTQGDPGPYHETLAATRQAPPRVRPEELPKERILPRISVRKAELAACDIRRVCRLLSLADSPDEAPATLREVWGRLVLDFELDEDPREVTVIPEARRFVAALHAAMPYLAGCLHTDPVVGQFRVYFGCLADLEALETFGLEVDAAHPSVVGRLREALTAVGQVAPRLGIDAAASYRGLLFLYPAELVQELFPEWAAP
jgi:hypothetical protein